MSIGTHLVGMDRSALADYIVALIDRIVPDGKAGQFRPQVEASLDEAIERTMVCVNHCRMWTPGRLNYLHSSQFCSLVYLLANSVWHRQKDAALPTRLFLVNKALNGIDLFYEIALPEPFFIGHSVGIVLAKVTYGRRLVLYQNSTVGRVGNDYPVIGEDVILYPNSAVIGRCDIADGTVVSQGTSILNRDTQPGSIAFAGEKGALFFKKTRDKPILSYFRNDEEMASLMAGDPRALPA